MPYSDPPLNPFASGPVAGGVEGHSLPQNPFQTGVGAGVVQSSSPSPFEAVGEEVSAQVDAPDGERHSPVSPFEIVEDQIPRPQQAAGSGFPMTGFPPGPAPMEQLGAAPVQASGGRPESPQQQEGVPSPMADPFAGMNVPRESGQTEGGAPSVPEEKATEELAVPGVTEGEAEPSPVSNASAEPGARQEVEEEEEEARPPSSGEEEGLPITSETKQLELRAIFGVDHELSHQEIIQRMRGLPGVLHVVEVSPAEVEALGVLRGCGSRLGAHEDEPVILNCSQGLIEFLEYDGMSLAVLRKDKYFPGVRETLFICARELSSL